MTIGRILLILHFSFFILHTIRPRGVPDGTRLCEGRGSGSIPDKDT